MHYDGTDSYQCLYMGYTYKAKNTDKALEKLCKCLNILALENLIHSCLAPPSSIPLAKTFGMEFLSAIFCFVLVPCKRLEETKALAGCCFEEGAVPNDLENCETELSEGEFLAEVRLTTFQYHTNKDHEYRAYLDNEINLYLAVLPKGTELISVTKCSVLDLSQVYEVRFRNPLMKKYKRVEFEFICDLEVLEEGKVGQFKLLTDVKYIEHSNYMQPAQD